MMNSRIMLTHIGRPLISGAVVKVDHGSAAVTYAHRSVHRDSAIAGARIGLDQLLPPRPEQEAQVEIQRAGR